jgi:signal transduction histidine kinase/CheY-like chemotaxis protein
MIGMFSLVKSNPLGRKILFNILFLSGLLTLLLTGLQIYLDYTSQIDELESDLSHVKEVYGKALSQALWTYDDIQLKILLESITYSSSVSYAAIKTIEGELSSSSGDKSGINYPIISTFELNISQKSKTETLGQLVIYAQEDKIRDKVRDKIIYVLVTQAFKTFIISFFILFLVRRWIFMPLQKLGKRTEKTSIDSSDTFEKLKTKYSYSFGHLNELGMIEESLIKMQDRIVEDVKLRERLEKESVQKSKLQALGTLAGGVAHDFNNILQGIFGVNFLIDDCIDQDNVEMRDLIDKSNRFATRGSEIVKEILLFSINEKTKVESVNLYESLDEVVKLGLLGRFKGFNVKFNCKETDLIISSSKPLLFQVFTNLISNACDVIDLKTGVVKVDVNVQDSKVAKYVKIEISDNGAGISKKNLEQIFDPFFTTKEVGKGTGLGLTIVHRIIKEMDGFITVNSELGVGTTFEILIPIRDVLPIATEEVKKIKTISSADFEKEIIMVDDEVNILELTRNWLIKKGCKVKFFSTPHECIAYLKGNSSKVGIVLTDYSMPNMTGQELAVEIKKLSDIPVVLMTGYLVPDLDQSVFYGQINKPFNVAKLFDLITEVLS